ncbi:bifunctional 5,10-methylenetetrahydrofolate dehydrogenase/5,10-methenyltetrahydrofolate cyclohydrolase [Rickettsia endosymbiont of Oedothorax gibbosus]|uniref:bifunctional 5,10-methylenetetrahydrofolate dehydrogenase/5,10-methenyltetrahydrofolate cyclohydrolase n=1 Tax=Rickettsia endosymbiont of Oedothorax gibbosus TaxID=931099 RepID=UPI002023E1DF|nr:tetrahydrofolate dehydrogenase/cyclohydrolase catalytic domain-containing protein [Rickettsia endosymbiont of Oedothorax gibbosus]
MNEYGNIINGKYFAEQILSKIKIEINLLKKQHNLIPTLAIILVGNNPASSIYVRNKLKAATKIGMNALQINLPNEVQIDHLLNEINILNNNSNISGIIVQLPLPKHINKNLILSAIDPSKDVDGFHPINVGYLHIVNSGELGSRSDGATLISNRRALSNDISNFSSIDYSNSGDGFIPCTALGCIELLKQVEKNLAGKNVVVIGRSNIVGKPLSALLLREDCTVTLCHSKTQNLHSITSRADIVISAIGSPLTLTEEYFNRQSIVIDVGISKLANSDKMVGDVDFPNVVDKVRYISPVPGGVGPMTVAFLLKNTLKAAKQNNHIYP